MDIVSIVIACFALAISVAVFVRDNQRYRILLQIRIPSFVVVWHKGNHSLVLFRLIFVNHSLCGRTVARVLITPPTDITEIPFAWVHDIGYKNVVALLPNSEKSKAFPIPEVLHDALDIPPHQSQSKWAGFLLKLPQEQDEIVEKKEFPLSFAALDVNDKFLSVLQIPLTLSELRTAEAYQVRMMRIISSYKVYKKR